MFAFWRKDYNKRADFHKSIRFRKSFREHMCKKEANAGSSLKKRKELCKFCDFRENENVCSIIAEMLQYSSKSTKLSSLLY
jgi:hypothetical protein